DVAVPADRMLGQLDGGWSVAMSILPYERSSCFWQRVAYLYQRLQRLVERAPTHDRAAEIVGEAYLQLHALRARSRATQHRLAATGTIGAETSIDKLLVATADQTTYDAARRLLAGTIELDDGAAGEEWRAEYLYSRAATIYGGTAEVQRNIVARRLLGLGGDEGSTRTSVPRGRRRCAPRWRPRSRAEAPTSTARSRSSAGWTCWPTSRTTRSASCSRRSARRTPRRPRSTTSS